ncbi:hypothetical protein Tco_1217959 [Tanacetum coccineum]
MGPPPATPGSEKSVSFQKSILGPRPKHIIINNAKVPVASDNEVKQFYKPLSKPGVGFSKPNFRSKTPPPRRVNNNYSRPKTPQPKRHVGRQNQPHGFPICPGVDLEPNEWVKDNECSKHMMGNRKLFSTYKAYNGGNVIFGSNLRGNIIGKGQICDNKCRVTFSEHDSEITKDGKVIVCRIRHEEEIDVHDYQILTREIIRTLKPLEEINRESVFCLGGNWDHVPACLCFMLYCVVHSERFNLAYYMAKRIEWVTKKARLILPYGILLTRLFKFIMNKYPELYNESYVLYDRVMNPLATQLERKPRRDRGTRRGRHSTSSSSAFDQPSSSHLNNDDDNGNDEGTSYASTPSSSVMSFALTNQVS